MPGWRRRHSGVEAVEPAEHQGRGCGEVCDQLPRPRRPLRAALRMQVVLSVRMLLSKAWLFLEYFSVCRYNRLEVVKLLVMRGADIDRRTEIGGLAPLHLSAMSVMDRINFVSKSCSLNFLFKIIICNCDFLGGQPCPAC